MDIGLLETASIHEEGAEVCILDASGKKTDFFITVMGVDSPEYQRRLIKSKNDFYRLIASGKELKPDDEITETVATLAAVTLGWRGLTSNGEEVVFSVKECKKLYSNAPRVRQQVENFVINAKNFTKG